ncbi:hypothetical protein JOQ06_000650 [Pogonophryne albipinna]|uniref:Uncharacterized protein n=1 Tax=Pogonophryne albipinna TaxID=1090488 RepID=A0AAD6AFN1_9TELE|nr:hypothetical protein JOQ06_000650 [Pogonophryne albipinna]
MITKDMLPLSFVEGEGFRELMNFVEPEYRVPTRKTIVSRVELKYEEGVKKLKMDISQSEKVAITTNSWTALTTESYTTITCHYITDDWEMKSAVLQTRSSDERHTAQNIAAQLQAAAEEWGLTDKITACVYDNASNMVLANRTIADWESVPCYAHTLQLAINDGFKVGSVHRVVAACGRLSLKCATTALCSETHVCISLEQPVTNSLLTRHLMSIPGESRVVGEFKEAVATSLRKRIIPESDDTSAANAGKKPVYIASTLDPRHKHLRFVAQTLRSEIVKNLSEMYRRVPDRMTSAPTNDTRISGHEAEDTSTATESDSENQPARAAAATGSDTRAMSLNTLFGEDYFTQDPDHNEIKEEFRRITTIHLERIFLTKLDFYTPKLEEIFGTKGGVAGTKIRPLLDSLSQKPSISRHFLTRRDGFRSPISLTNAAKSGKSPSTCVKTNTADKETPETSFKLCGIQRRKLHMLQS